MIKEWLLRFMLAFSPAQNNAPAKTLERRSKQSMASYLRRRTTYRVDLEMSNYRNAIDAAEMPTMPRRASLYAMYKAVEEDDQVFTQLRIAKATVTKSPYDLVAPNGKPDPEAAKLLATTWFDRLMEVLVDTEFWGHSLVEFDPIRKDGRFTNFNLLPREHVRPEYGDVLAYATDLTGIPYRDQPDFPYLLEIGDPFDLGAYRVVAKPVIRKKYADTDWSIYSEKFGMPYLTIKTSTTQKNELDAKAEMAANFGSNGWAILDEEDEINLHSQTVGANSHHIYSDRMTDADNRIAKIMNGQTGASDEKAYVGSAEVHERLLNEFTLDRLTRIERWVNDQLVPFLLRWGYPLAGYTFEFPELKKRRAKLIAETPDPKAPTDPNGDDPAPERKKKPLTYRGSTGPVPST